MASSFDFHLLAQVIVYFACVVCGMAVSITIGVTTAKMNDNCILYADVHLKGTTAYVDFTSMSKCDFPVYASVTGILYALGVGIFHTYALTKKDPSIGAGLFVLPFICFNSVLTFLIFVGACILSVGFKTFCDNYADANNGVSCERLQETGFIDKDIDSSSYYDYFIAGESACWVLFLLWLAQVALGVARFVRNRRQGSQAS